MTRIPLMSRLIESVQYNPDTRTLHIWFRSRRHRAFSDIPPAKFENLINADSPGFYYAYYIAPIAKKMPKPIVWSYRLVGAVFTAALLMIPG